MNNKFISILLLASVSAKCQKVVPKYVNLDSIEMRCGVIHGTKDGYFSCNFNGTYYPITIFDTTKTRWYIESVKGDSVFYYKSIVTDIYIWNGRPKNEMYGYELQSCGGCITLPDLYIGDTLKTRRQEWSPK